MTIEQYMELPYRIEIEEENGKYRICYPELPNCFVIVSSLDRLVETTKSLKRCWFQCALHSNFEIPLPTMMMDIL
ncbi:MAG: hypothetical protein J6D36_04095 [Erysipelotrichaceae bacterium]|nr:hypothetical protein [Erysipelotrichaceae bacterium]